MRQFTIVTFKNDLNVSSGNGTLAQSCYKVLVLPYRWWRWALSGEPKAELTIFSKTLCVIVIEHLDNFPVVYHLELMGI